MLDVLAKNIPKYPAITSRLTLEHNACTHCRKRSCGVTLIENEEKGGNREWKSWKYDDTAVL